jgi:hypothetical protein
MRRLLSPPRSRIYTSNKKLAKVFWNQKASMPLRGAAVVDENCVPCAAGVCRAAVFPVVEWMRAGWKVHSFSLSHKRRASVGQAWCLG